MAILSRSSVCPTPTHTLKSTGEKVIAINFWKYDGRDYARCILPPQAPDHRDRRADVHMDKLKPLAGSRD